MSNHLLHSLLLLTAVVGLSFIDLVSSSHFRGGIIMTRPQPGGEPYQIEISYRVSWRRSYRYGLEHHYCDSSTIESGQVLAGQDSIDCQYGCSGRVTSMSYICTSFSATEDWTFGENQLIYNFSFAAGNIIAIGTYGTAWIAPFSGYWNVSTTFSLAIRNDTGRINSSPRTITAPVIRLQEGCNHTIALAVSDPDGDIVRCRWAVGNECYSICGGFPAYLYFDTCTIQYQANHGARYWAASIMIEDFLPGSSVPLSTVALQFLVLVVSSTEPCSQKPRFVHPTLRRGSCVAIPPDTTFTTQLIADVGSGSDASIMEIVVIPPLGTRVGTLTQILASNNYYVNVTWTPSMNQQNLTHLLCFIAVRSDNLASDQVCIDLLAGYFPPTPIQITATPNQQLVHPSNTTWRIMYDRAIRRPSLGAFIRFFTYHTEEEVYNINASQSQEVTFNEQGNEISITPDFLFEEKTLFYITFDRGIVKGTQECGPENEPLVDKNFWTFETMDLTPPSVTFLENPMVTNANVSFSWESNENATWECILLQGAIESAINCSGAYWREYNLSEGPYTLIVRATDEAGNTASVTHTFEVDLTPPTATLVSKPNAVSNEQTATFTFSCNETCSFECQLFSVNTTGQIMYSSCNAGSFITPTLQPDAQYTFTVTPTDQVGNTGQGVSFTWETDFDDPQIVGIQNTSISCMQTSPEYTGEPRAIDNRPGNVSLMYSDHDLLNGCFIRRIWIATDRAGNIGQMIQIIMFEFSPIISLLPQVNLPCDSATASFEVANSTARIPNPCELPVQLTYEDSDYLCPGTFGRNWTVNVCGSSANASQIVHTYDLCPPHACGRNESIPRGICSYGQCQCNQPWYGDDCNNLIYQPLADPVNDSVLLEAQEYTVSVAVSQGTPPLSWSLVSGPENFLVDQYTGQVMWNRARVGNHSIIVQIDNEVGSTQVEWNLLVTPSYNASLLPVVPTLFPYVQPVMLRGYIEYETNIADQLQGEILPVDIDIVNDGIVKTLRAYTTINGSFSLTYYPSSTEYGTYTAEARHPNFVQLSMLSQVQWGILGMTPVPRSIILNGEAIQNFENIFYNATVIYNDGPGPLSGLTATPILPDTSDVSVDVFLQGSLSNGTLAPGERLFMDIRVTTAYPINGLFLISVESLEGTRLQMIANLRVEPLLPSLSISPPSLVTRIIPGRPRVLQFNVVNLGGAPANNVQVLVPNNDFISFISFGNTQLRGDSLRLQNGESALLSILAQTPVTQQLGEIDATIIVASDEIYAALRLNLIISSDTLMNLTVVVEDEYTYFASGRPLVSDAVITLINNDRNLRLIQSTETGNGRATFYNIYEDRYQITIEAPSHRSFRQIIVTSVESPVLTVFIERQTVIYTWTVTPIPFQDIYSISIEADFETRVPIPVVTVTPNEINLLELETNHLNSFQLNITNHGLIRADNVEIRLPSHPFLEFSTNAEFLGDLEPLSSIIVSINSTRRSVQKRNTFNRLGNGLANAVNWATYVIDVVHSYVCSEPQFRNSPVVLKEPTICDNQLDQPSGNLVNLGPTTCRDCTAYYTPVDPGDYTPPSPDFGPNLGRPGSARGIPSFSNPGYSSEPQPVFCNPCLSNLVGCLAPSPIELVLKNVPLAGCIPLLLAGTNPLSSALNATKWLQCTVGNPLTGLALCAYEKGLFSTCINSGTSTSSQMKRNIRRSVNEIIEALYPIQQSIALGAEVLGNDVWISVGDPQWLSTILRPTMADNSEAGVLISATELSAILAAPSPNGTSIEMVANMVERINNTLYGWNNGVLEPVEGSNMASFSTVQELTQNIDTYNEIAKGKGFSSYIDAYNFAGGQFNQIRDFEEDAGVCAVVRIRIQQELAITREAFLARLQIENMEDSSLEQINIEIIVTDLFTGELSTSLFSIGNGSLSGSLTTSINGQWMLPSDETGAVEWLIIPYSEAAPDSNRIYNVGGSLSYLVGSENITVPLSPTPITVTPDPSLLVHYFWERYVVADNPFTDVVEPSVPFTLGVAVKNAGFGTANSLQISSAQPEIIDNERGLLISFMIIGANIGSERATPSLTVRFGDLAPNTTMVARWYMISSLQGEFMGYTATFENVNPLGDPKLSVLDDLQIHELIRNVMIYTKSEEDEIPDFLVNDRDDYLAYPDALYSSKTLQQYNVSVGTILSVQMNIMISSLVVRTSTNNTGWVYYRYEDTQGILNTTALSVNGTKYEGNQTVVLPSENSWITSDRDERTETKTYYLHILDYVETTDEVVFILNPCTDDCPTLGLPFTRPTIKLPTPSVSVSAPMEVLYAGTTTPLTLTCNVTTDPSLADSINVSVTWLRGTSQLSDATGRVSISSLSRSQSTFTSTLTVYPLSVNDATNFTCKAGIVPLVGGGLNSTTASDLGEGTVFIVVEVPPAPSVNIAASSDLTYVGESLSLLCSAMVVPSGLINDPTLTWSGSGVDQSSAQLSREALNLSLSFSPLYTSQGGVYVCTARIAIPEAGVDVMATQEITVYAQIPPPTLTIIGSPRDTDFSQGLDITFACNIELSSGVDSPVVVESIWWKNETILESSSDDRITVNNATEVMLPSVYQTSVRLNPMDFDDADTYVCEVTVMPLNGTFIAGTSESTSRNITDISSFPAQNVTVTDEGVSIAGYAGYSLLCTVTREQDLSSLTIISIQWFDPNGLEILGSDQAINISSEGSANDPIITSRLIFNSLLTSQAGEYTCRSSMTIPGTDILNYTVDEAFTITVKLPAPEAVVIFENRESPLYEGTTFSLSCLITPNMTGVDTEFEIQRSFVGPETSATERISQSDTMTSFNDILLSYSFSPLTMNDTGIYECSAIALSILPNITASDPIMNETMLSILELPAPEVNIYSATSQPIAGGNHSLICSAVTEDYLVASPILKWISIEDTGGISISESTSAINSSTLALNFHPLRTSHGGPYTCEATLDIPQADINNLTSSNTENITILISAPVISITEHPIPYNGTVFTLSGVASLDPSVDTDVTAEGVWSAVADDVGTPLQISTSPPYQTDLEFQPLNTDSSDEYILNVTFRPSDDSPFISENSGSIIYNLMVQPLPPRPPTISVILRYPSFDNECGEARILDCRANPVENLFIPPNITWIGPDGSEVPVGGESNPMISPQTGQLIFSDITSTNSGQYVCRAIVNISVANILEHFDDAMTSVNTNAPGPVTNLMCNKSSLSSPSGLSISWELPTVLGGEVIGYQVEVKELQHKDGTKDVVSVDITDFNTKLQEASLNEGLTDMVPYEIRVKAINLAGCGEQQYVYCFTQEGEPPSPKNVVVYKINSTAINVTWDKQSLVELKGLADYTIEYSTAVSNRRRQLSGVVTVPWTESHVVITNLTPGAQYDVSVSVSTSVGMSDRVRGMLRDVSTTPPSVADAKGPDIGIIIGGTALALVVVIAVAATLIVAIIVAMVVKNRRDEFKLKSTRSSLPPAASGKMLSSISYNNDSYKDPCDDVKSEQQQSSL